MRPRPPRLPASGDRAVDVSPRCDPVRRAAGRAVRPSARSRQREAVRGGADRLGETARGPDQVGARAMMPTEPMTKQQHLVYGFVRDFLATHEYAPTLEEISRALELSSLATVHKHL